MAIRSISLAHRLEGFKLADWEQHLPALAWVAFRWGAWAVGVGLAIGLAEPAVQGIAPLLLLVVSTVCGLAASYVVLTRTVPNRFSLPIVAVDVLLGAGLVRLTAGLQSPFLAYDLAIVAGAGWLLGTREGIIFALVTAGVAVAPPFSFGSYVGYVVTVLAFGGMASWLSRQAELFAQRLALQQRVEMDEGRLALLHETIRRCAAQVLGTLDPSRVYLATANAARELVGAERAVVLLADDATGELRLVYDSGGARELLPRRFAVSVSGPSDWAGDGQRLCDLLVGHGLPATLAAPMRVLDRLLGVLAVEAEPLHIHTRSEREALDALASVAASALAAARVHTERMRTHRRQDLRQTELAEALLTLQGAIESVHDDGEICRRVAAGVAAALQADRAGVFLLSESGDAAYLAGKHGLGWDEQATLARGFPLAEEYPLGICAMRAAKLLTCGPQESLLLLAEAEQRGSGIAVPLLVGEEVIGAVFAESGARERPWREPEQRFLRVLGHHAGLALRRAQQHRLSERRAAHIQSLVQASQAVNSELELSSVLDNIIHQAAGVPGAHFAGIILSDTEHARLRAFVVPEARTRELSVELEDELFATVIATRDARIATRADELPREIRDLGLLSAVIAQPMLVGQRVIGVLLLGRASGAKGGPEQDLRFLRFLAEQAALAISRARLHHRAEREERHNAMLLQVMQLAASGIDLRDKLRTIATLAASAVDAERASIYLFDGRQFLTPMAAVGFDEGEGAFDHVALDVDAEAFCRDLVRHKRVTQVEARLLAQGRLAGWPLLQADVRRVLGVPLVAGERVAGALFIHERHTRRLFAADEIELLLGIAREAAMVVDTEDLNQEVQDSLRRERLFAQIGRDLGSGQGLEQRLATVLEHLAETLPIAGASIGIVDQRSLRVIAAYGAAERACSPAAQLPEGHDVIDWLSQNRGPYATAASDSQGTVSSAWSYLAAPLVGGGETLGVLQVSSERQGAFGDRELNLLTAVGNEVAGALVRERLLGHIRELSVWKDRAVKTREIHETAGRMLAGAVIKLGATDMLIEVDRDQALGELRQAKGLAIESLDELRRGVHTLNPADDVAIPALPAGVRTER